MSTDKTKNATERTETAADHHNTAILGAGEIASGLVMDRPEMLDRVVQLGREARAVETVELKLPWNVPGLPDTMQALVKHTSQGPSIEPIRSLFEPFRCHPERRKGTAHVTTLQSFVDLVNRHKAVSSVVFAKTAWPEPALTAVIDYHVAPASDMDDALYGHLARWGEHLVLYTFPLTDEFKAWMSGNGVQMEQGAFATFLENQIDELTAPMDQERSTYEPLFKERFATPSQLIDLSRSLEIFVGQKVKRQERLATGERTVFFETEHSNAKGEPIEIPGIFMIAVAAFVDGERIRLPARLRYRIKSSEIVWFYQLYRPEFWLRAQVQNDLLTVAQETGLPTYEGAPEMGLGRL